MRLLRALFVIGHIVYYTSCLSFFGKITKDVDSSELSSFALWHKSPVFILSCKMKRSCEACISVIFVAYCHHHAFSPSISNFSLYRHCRHMTFIAQYALGYSAFLRPSKMQFSKSLSMIYYKRKLYL